MHKIVIRVIREQVDPSNIQYMKKILPIGLAALMTVPAFAGIPKTETILSCSPRIETGTQINTPLHRTAPEFSFTLAGQKETKQHKVAAKANASVVNFSPKIINAKGDNLSFVLLVGENADGSLEYYGGEDGGSGIDLSVPEGIYDFMAFGYTTDLEGTIMLTRYGVEVKDGFSIEFNSADADKRVDISNIGPAGEVIIPEPGSCYVACAMNLMFYRGDLALYGQVDYRSDIQKYCRSNEVSGDFSMARSQYYATTEGMLTIALPIDFSTTATGSTAEGWQMATRKFAETPFNIFKDELMHQFAEAEGIPVDELVYTMSKYSIYLDGESMGTAGFGIDGAAYDSGKVGIWAPDGYEAVSHSMLPLGSVMSGDDSAIIGLPLVRGENGLVDLGVNTSFDSYMYFSEGDLTLHSNPVFAGISDDTVYGNCAPSVIMAPNGAGMLLNCVGRNSEIISLDSWNIYDNIDPEGIEFWGGGTNTVVVSLDGKALNDSREDFPYGIDWYKKGIYTVDFSTDNILIDGELSGLTSAKMTYNSNSYGGVFPTVTALTFLDNEGGITDRFLNAADGTLSIYAAGLQVRVNETGGFFAYYGYNEVSDVTAEYAPSGTEDFLALPLSANPDGDFMPGYGYNYQASLGDVDAASANGWFDLRVTVKDANGSEQIQTISPAFHIDALSGVKNVSDTEAENPTYYNLQGVRISDPHPGQIVIEKRGNRTVKKITDF